MCRIACGLALLLSAVLLVSCSKQQNNNSLPVGTGNQSAKAVPDRCSPTYVVPNDKDWADQAIVEGSMSLSEPDKSQGIARAYDAKKLSKLWLACPIEMLTLRWGAPARQLALPGGSAVLVWEAHEVSSKDGEPVATCEISVTTDSAGGILGVASKETNRFSSSIATCQIDRRTGPYID